MKKDKIYGIITTFLYFLVFYPIYHPLYFRYTTRDTYYSHGFLVPLIVAYLIFRKKNVLKEMTRKPNYFGLLLIILGVIVHLISRLFLVNFTSYAAFFSVLCGLVLFIFGTKIFKTLLPSLLFIIFMLPLPHAVIIQITFKMKIFASQISNSIANFLGLASSVVGSKILYPGGELWVGDPCSGLRSLISFLALGYFMILVVNDSYYKKIGILISIIPIALLSNISRILTLLYASFIYGQENAMKYLHDITGILVFIIGLTLFMGVVKILKCQIDL